GRKNGWVPITIAALAFASLGLPDGALGVAWPSIRRELGLPLGELGSLLVVMTVGHLLSSFGSGPAAARLGAGRLLLWSNLAFAASALGFALAPGGWALLLARLVRGTAAGLISCRRPRAWPRSCGGGWRGPAPRSSASTPAWRRRRAGGPTACSRKRAAWRRTEQPTPSPPTGRASAWVVSSRDSPPIGWLRASS